MAEAQTQETQQELFDFAGGQKRIERVPSIQRGHKPILIHTSVEQLLFLTILGILSGCLVFFLGVLRGKAIVAEAPVRVAAPAGLARGPSVTRPSQAVEIPRQVVPAEPARQALSSEAKDPSKPYTIQLASYRKLDPAEREAASLRRSGHYATVQRKGDYFILCVGQYTGMEEAKKDLKFFGVKYKDRYLRRR